MDGLTYFNLIRQQHCSSSPHIPAHDDCMQATGAGNGHPLPNQGRDSFAPECSRRVPFRKEYVPADMLGGKYY